MSLRNTDVIDKRLVWGAMAAHLKMIERHGDGAAGPGIVGGKGLRHDRKLFCQLVAVYIQVPCQGIEIQIDLDMAELVHFPGGEELAHGRVSLVSGKVDMAVIGVEAQAVVTTEAVFPDFCGGSDIGISPGGARIRLGHLDVELIHHAVADRDRHILLFPAGELV